MAPYAEMAAVSPRLARKCGESSSWGFGFGEKIAPGLVARGRLGAGFRFETWMAWSVPQWSPVVVKIPRRDELSTRTLAALAREAETVLAVSHPSVQRLLEAKLAASLPHLIYEYIDGPTLADLLAEVGKLAPADVIRLGMQVGASLHHLHKLGIVHSDVTPSSVCLRDGRAILLGFDIARPVGGVRPAADRARGTPAYMAPEQVGGLPAATPMDLWALGAALHEAAAGRPAFDSGGTRGPNRYPQLEKRAAPLRTLDSSIPAALERLVSRLLESLPSRRPSAAMTVLWLLEDAAPGSGDGSWPSRVAEPPPARPGAPRERFRLPRGRSTNVRVKSVRTSAYRE